MKYFLIFFILITSFTAYASPLVVLEPGKEKYPLGLYLDYFEDKEGKLTIDDLSSPEFRGKFTRSNVEVPNFGFTGSGLLGEISG